jgi:hypothetical protein
MMTTETYRKLCLKGQTDLRRLLTSSDQFGPAIQLFLHQHAMLHSAKMAGTELWSFEDEVLEGMTDEQVCRVPRNREHSAAWLVWHMARCEDITMNLLVAGSPQVLLQDNWLERLKVTICHTGNAMSVQEVAAFSLAVDVPALRAYRLAVGRQTRQVVQHLQPEELKRKVDPACIRQVWEQGAVLEAARDIVDYWSKRDVAGLLLMPATRHNLIHLNEAFEIRQKLLRTWEE